MEVAAKVRIPKGFIPRAASSNCGQMMKQMLMWAVLMLPMLACGQGDDLPMYKCPGDLYTNAITAKEASEKGCVALKGTPITAVFLPKRDVPGYTTLNVKNRVQIEIPNDWTIGDAEYRKQVKEISEEVTGIAGQHTASLSARSFPAPSRIFVRVSFLKVEPPISQAELRKEIETDRQQVTRVLADAWKEESKVMWAGFAKMGVREVGRATFNVEPVGGQTALVIRYGRTSTVNPQETMRVAQYHVLLGDEKALITLSYIDGDKGATTAHNRLKRSIKIR